MSGDRCPVTKKTRRGYDRVLGDGPAYPDAGYFHQGTTLEAEPRQRTRDGGYAIKVRWFVIGYDGPLLFRAGGLDGHGRARVDPLYTSRDADGGVIVTGPVRDLPAVTVVDGPGCYGYQVDGIDFSTVIVFRVVAPGAREA